MRRLLALGAILACAVVPGTAQASKPTKVEIAASKWVASQEFPQTRCEDVSLAFLNHPWWASRGWAKTEDAPSCWVSFDRFYPWRESPALFCSVLTHEWGHVAGLGHSSDPTNVMYASFVGWPPCYALFGR